MYNVNGENKIGGPINTKTDFVWDKVMEQPTPKPELNVIIDRLDEAVLQYERINSIVTDKLNYIQTRRVGSIKDNSNMGSDAANTLLDIINGLIDRLNKTNSMMLDNIEHLNEIV
jgi:hypothetical protein